MTESLKSLLSCLAFLRAIYQVHQNAHWNMKGDPFYGDHLLFQRLYGGMEDEIDTLAEKIVGIHGPHCVVPGDQSFLTHSLLNYWDTVTDCPIKRSLYAEEELQVFLKELYTGLDGSGDLSLGMDDFIMSLASDHETNLYLLRQRTG